MQTIFRAPSGNTAPPTHLREGDCDDRDGVPPAVAAQVGLVLLPGVSGDVLPAQGPPETRRRVAAPALAPDAGSLARAGHQTGLEGLIDCRGQVRFGCKKWIFDIGKKN